LTSSVPIGTHDKYVPVSYMAITHRTALGQNYALVVVGVVFVALLVSAGIRGTPSVLMIPLETSFGWTREQTSFAAAIGILLYGLVGPFAAALMQSFGIKRTLLTALGVMALSTGASVFMTAPWHYLLTWGVLTGLGGGAAALVLGAAVVNRWFVTNRGLMMGILTASTATGSLVFLPALAAISTGHGWRPAVLTVAAAALILMPVVWWLLPERPEDRGLVAYGAIGPAPKIPPTGRNPFAAAFGGLARASRRREFWLLAAGFFICGFTTNGLVGTHLISFCGDYGIPAVTAAGLVATMGIFDLIGTTASGWLTDRFDPRKLLFVYYGLRGLSLIYLPFSDFSFYSLSLFAVFYGLDWIATVPPTVRLANEVFGERDATVTFGWIAASHQIGAASAAFFAGYVRADTGSYFDAFIFAGFTAIVAALLSLAIRGAAARPAAAS
jgi:predicted MFS family arabinose efflux permease